MWGKRMLLLKRSRRKKAIDLADLIANTETLTPIRNLLQYFSKQHNTFPE